VKVTTTITTKTSTGGGRGCVGGRGGGRALAAVAFAVTKLDHRPGGRTDDVTHPRQQSTHDDSWGGRRQEERGTIVVDRMTEKGREGGDLVETFELLEITSLPNFRAPKSSKRTGTYSACVLSVRLLCQRHGQLMFRSQSEGRLTGVLSIFSYLGIFVTSTSSLTLS
jgi:hypothetical protein